MPIPETTSAEAFERYVGGKCLRAGRGEAWQNIKAWIVALPSSVDALHLPSVSELMRRKASPLFVRGIAQAIAIHLARNYAEMANESRSGSPSLPGYKLRQITDWIAEHVAEEFNLDRLAAQAGLSKFYFNRLFKSAVGVSPSRYHINLRMDAATRRALNHVHGQLAITWFNLGKTFQIQLA